MSDDDLPPAFRPHRRHRRDVAVLPLELPPEDDASSPSKDRPPAQPDPRSGTEAEPYLRRS